MEKEKCEELYGEYKKLKAEIDYVFKARDVIPEKRIEVHTVPPFEHMERYRELKKILRNDCKNCLNLTPGDWFKIEHGAE